MSKVEGTILCGKCKVEIAGPIESLTNESICHCPKCGQEERTIRLSKRCRHTLLTQPRRRWTVRLIKCQSACKFDPSSASNFDPFVRRGLTVALGSLELAGIAETRRARVA